MKRYFRELSVVGALLAVLFGLAWFAPAFFSPQPLLSLVTREAPTLVVACGMACVIITRQIDISVGSMFSVCSVCAGLLVARGWPLVLVLPASVGLGALFGAFNGFLVAVLRLPSIVVTLATMVTLRQGLNLIRQGEFVNLPDRVQWFGLSQTAGQLVLVGAALGMLVALAWAMRHVAAGRYLYAVGSDAEAARLAGIRPQRVTLLVFVFIGALTGLGAMMNLAQSPQVQPLTGNGLELKVIAAVVVGDFRWSRQPLGSLRGVVIARLCLASTDASARRSLLGKSRPRRDHPARGRRRWPAQSPE
jgi:rhamnose transport system permease protein